MSLGSDGYWRPDVHAQFLTDDAAVILMHYTGLVQQTERFAAAADADQPPTGPTSTSGWPCASKPGRSSIFGSKTPSDRVRGVSRAVTLSPMAHSATRITPAAASSARSTARRTQSACRTDRHDEPSSPIADTPTSFAGQTIRATSRLCTADDRYRWVTRAAGCLGVLAVCGPELSAHVRAVSVPMIAGLCPQHPMQVAPDQPSR